MSRKGLKGSSTIGGNDVLTIDQLRHQDDWVLDTERYRCHVCTRNFTRFRRKHHCRKCGEVVCGNCTLKKEAELPVIGRSLVRVCMSCILSHANGQANPQAPPAAPTTGTTASPPPREEHWEAQNFHSPTGNSEGDLTHFTRDFQQPEFDYPLDFSWDHPWPKPPIVPGESERLEILRGFDIMDTPSEDVFDIICDLASNALKSPIAAVSLLDEDREWFKASVGLAQNEVPRSVSFCAHAIMSKEPMVVMDTLLDKRFAKNPLPRNSCDIATLEKLSNVAMKNLEDRKNAVAAPLDNGAAVEVVENDEQQAEAPKRPAEPLRGSGIGIANQVVAQPVPGASQDLVAANAGDGQVTAGPKMETMLMDLLCRTTETQQQLATQQGAMFHTLGQHTADIDKLATAMARMEAKLDAMAE
ncbi:Lateral signaling target protein 2 [Phytophthora cinnamomi]|uniref:Lateral signaling target protein 2 n=1 Tax=Phytophthora cinnamomi TaxID=4785 RepID=UPI00355AC55C|nr:Lateral signaling target protein 2 [Phytophthora cinnamomi]